jgi:hypothetical protein
MSLLDRFRRKQRASQHIWTDGDVRALDMQALANEIRRELLRLDREQR